MGNMFLCWILCFMSCTGCQFACECILRYWLLTIRHKMWLLDICFKSFSHSISWSIQSGRVGILCVPSIKKCRLSQSWKHIFSVEAPAHCNEIPLRFGWPLPCWSFEGPWRLGFPRKPLTRVSETPWIVWVCFFCSFVFVVYCIF